MRRYLAAALLSLMTATPVFAADAADSAAEPAFATTTFSSQRPGALMPMYAMSFALQGYDAWSTLSALRAGGREANPMMQSVVGSPVAFTAVKVGTAAATFLASERLWKTHHRTAALAVMAVSNIGMSMVAVNNARALSSLK